MAESTSPVARLAKAYSVLTRSDAGARWRWSMQILNLRDSQPEKKRGQLDKEIGAECAKSIGRGKPYSPQWVRAYVNAARQFQTEPTTAAECDQFLALCNNAQSQTAAAAASAGDNGSEAQESEAKQEGTKADALRMLASAIKLARKRGATDDEIIQSIRANLGKKVGA